MSLRTATSTVLLVFVALAVVVMFARNARRDELSPSGGGTAGPTTAETDYVAAYYFHGNRRCPTCEKIEAFAREAVLGGFAEQIADGRLRWGTINYDETGNEHYMDDYGLSFQMVVLIEYQNGEQQRWTTLPRIWDLVGDQEAFQEYVRGELNSFLGSG